MGFLTKDFKNEKGLKILVSDKRFQTGDFN